MKEKAPKPHSQHLQIRTATTNHPGHRASSHRRGALDGDTDIDEVATGELLDLSRADRYSVSDFDKQDEPNPNLQNNDQCKLWETISKKANGSALGSLASGEV
jgi:hypothetical protein